MLKATQYIKFSGLTISWKTWETAICERCEERVRENEICDTCFCCNSCCAC